MIAGLDIGSRRLALFYLKENRGFTIKLPRARPKVDDRQAVLTSMRTWLSNPPLLLPSGIECILWVDAPYLGNRVRNVQTAMLLAGVADVARVSWPGPVHAVNPSSWKKVVIGDGSADKDAIRKWVEQHRPEVAAACEGDQDLLDASCVAEFGRRVAEEGLEARKSVRRRRSRALLRPS